MLIEQLVLIKKFELSYELFWNTLKVYLLDQKVEVRFPDGFVQIKKRAEDFSSALMTRY